MKMSRRFLSIVLAVLMVMSLATVAVSAYTVPEGFDVAVEPGNDETNINGEVYGLLGDADVNDKVNVKDATAIQKFAASLIEFDEIQKVVSDANFDGNTNVKDATAIQKWVAGMEVDFPINHLIYIPAETTPTESTPAETTPTESTPAETTPTESTPADTDPTESTPADTDPTESTPAETTPTESTPADTDPTESIPADTTPTESIPADTTPTETEPADDTITVYFTNNKGWENAYIYGFYGVVGESATGEPLGVYPGTKMTFVEVNKYGQDIYSCEVPADIDYIKFSDGSAENNRTDNIDKSEFTDKTGFYLEDKGTKYWPYATYEYVPTTPEETEPTATETTPAETEPTATETTPAETEPTATETTPAETEPTATETTPAETEPTATETTPAETEPTETEPVDTTIKVYAINSVKWASVSAYYWGGTAASVSWPGEAMTKTAEKVNGFDVYEFTFDAAPANIIFNNNNNGSQTSDLTFEAGKYFDIKSAKWYDSLDDVPAVSAVATDRYLAGSFNNWSTTATEFKLKAEGEKIAYVELELAANTTYEFKIVREGTWTSCKDTLSITNTVSGLTFSSSIQGNTKITTKNAGTYVFAFGMEDSQLSVTYP